ncbi:MAG TPA: 6-bladed beta-propeller [Bacteroidales bacterium]|nr:6-bladed beta-propeller [Bacteroidales bacterium]
MNVKHILLFLAILVVPHTSISQSTNGKVLRIKVDFESFENVKMSEVFSDITYLPLETNPNCLIGYMDNAVFGNEILINSNDSDQSIYRFTEDGKFLNKIGQIGRGPDEYQNRSEVRLIDNTVYVVSSFSNNIICYSLKGDFIKKYHLNIEANPKSIIQLNDKSFFVTLAQPSKLGSIIRTDQDFNIKAGYIKYMPLKSNNLASRFQRSGNHVFYYHNYRDTIFDLSKGYPVPAIVMDYGKYRVAKEKRSVYEEDNIILNSPFIYDFYTNNDYLMFRIAYPFKGHSFYVLNKISDGTQTRWVKLINDIDCGSFEHLIGYLSANSFIITLMPSEIIEKFDNMTKAEKADPKNSQFINMVSKISLESNPVLMICELK